MVLKSWVLLTLLGNLLTKIAKNLRYMSKKCLVGDLVVSEYLDFSLVCKLVVLRKFLVVSVIFNLATLASVQQL